MPPIFQTTFDNTSESALNKQSSKSTAGDGSTSSACASQNYSATPAGLAVEVYPGAAGTSEPAVSFNQPSTNLPGIDEVDCLNSVLKCHHHVPQNTRTHHVASTSDKPERASQSTVPQNAPIDDDITTTHTWSSVNELIRPKGIIKMVSQFNFFENEKNTIVRDEVEADRPPSPVQSPQSDQIGDKNLSEEKRQTDGGKNVDDIFQTDKSCDKEGDKSILDILVDFEKTMDESLKDFQEDSQIQVVLDNKSRSRSRENLANKASRDEVEPEPIVSFHSQTDARSQGSSEQTRNEIRLLRENNDQYRSEIERMEEEYRSELKLLEDRHKKQFSELKAMYQSEMDRLIEDKDAAIVEASQQAEKIVERSRVEVENVMKQLDNYKQLASATIQSNVDERAKEITLRKEEEMTARLDAVRKAYEDKLEQVRKDCEEFIEKEKEKVAESIIKTMTAKHDEEISVIMEQLTELQTWQRTMSTTLSIIRDNFEVHYPKEMAVAKRSGRFTGNAREKTSQDAVSSLGPETSRLLDEVLELFAYILEKAEKNATTASTRLRLSGVHDLSDQRQIPDDGNSQTQYVLRHDAELAQMRIVQIESQRNDEDTIEQKKECKKQNESLVTKQEETVEGVRKENQARKSLSSQMDDYNVDWNSPDAKIRGGSDHTRSCHSAIYSLSRSPSVRKARSFRLASPRHRPTSIAYQKLEVDGPTKENDEIVAARLSSSNVPANSELANNMEGEKELTDSNQKPNVSISCQRKTVSAGSDVHLVAPSCVETVPGAKQSLQSTLEKESEPWKSLSEEGENDDPRLIARSFRGARSIKSLFSPTKNSQTNHDNSAHSPRNDSVRSLRSIRLSRLSISTVDGGNQKQVKSSSVPFGDKTPKFENKLPLDDNVHASCNSGRFGQTKVPSTESSDHGRKLNPRMIGLGSSSHDSDAENLMTSGDVASKEMKNKSQELGEVDEAGNTKAKSIDVKKKVYRRLAVTHRPARQQYRDFSTSLPSPRNMQAES
jgi:hypothetical protein